MRKLLRFFGLLPSADDYRLLMMRCYHKKDYKCALEYLQKKLDIDFEIGIKKLNSNFEDYPMEIQIIVGDYLTTGNFLCKLDEYKEALEYYEKALSIQKKVRLIEEDLDISSTYNHIALAYDKQGQYQKALDYYDKALNIQEQEKALGKEYIDIASTYKNIASTYNNKEDYQQSLKYFLKVAEIEENGWRENDINITFTYSNIALIYGKLGKYDKALDYYNKVIKIKKENILGMHDIKNIDTYHNIALIYNNQKDFQKALEYFDYALMIWEKYKNGLSKKSFYYYREKIDEVLANINYTKKSELLRAKLLSRNVDIHSYVYQTI